VSCRLVALFLCALFLTCVHGIVVTLALACVSFRHLLLFFNCDQHCKNERLQLVEIPHKRETTIRKKTVVFKWIIGSLERG
jgi:MFS superfamily sulfate permease-like transporter